MNNAKLAEDIKRLLPEERFKRIRQAIMLSTSAAAGRANDVRQELNDSQKIDKGVLIEGSLEFTSPISATLSLWAWMFEFQVFQIDSTTLTVLAPDAEFVRKDYFHGNNQNEIFYSPGILDAEGNSLMPNIPIDHIILASVIRNPNGTNEDPEIPSVNDGNLQSTTEKGNSTNLPIIHAPAAIDIQSATLGQVKNIINLTDNKVRTVIIPVNELSGVGDIRAQVANYINENLTIISTRALSSIKFLVQESDQNSTNTLPNLLPYKLV
ncbi:hypothetical protein [Belliella pelovolcani]|uniref:hypothetical protein n=1 Tax=Belliella pelovolcani TaxID=529505 RepID=UPI00391A3C26